MTWSRIGGMAKHIHINLAEGSVRGAFKVGRSSSNPGYLSIRLRDAGDLAAAGRVFPDMAEASWLRDQVAEGATTESLGVQVLRDTVGGLDRWDCHVWWEDRRHGLDISIRDTDDGTLRVEARPMRGASLRAEIHTYPRPRGRVDGKDIVIRATQNYLKGVLAGTNGQDRVFAKRKRAKPKAGGAAQTKVIDKIRRMAGTREVGVEPRGAEVRVAVRPAPWPAGHGQTLLLVWVGPTGGVNVTDVATGQTLRGRSAWSAIEAELGSSR